MTTAPDVKTETVSITNLPQDPPVVRAVRWLLRYAFLFGLVLVFVYFSAAAPQFLSPSNLITVLENSAILLLVAMALTLVVSSGGIDLSVGVALDFGAWFSIVGMLVWGLPWPAAVALGVVAGACIGALNALLIVGLGVTPFLATLGTFFIGRSIQLIGTNGGANISYREAPDGFRALAGSSTLGIPNEILIVAVIAVVAYIFLSRSAVGRKVQAMGLQDSAARIAGLPTRRLRVWVYIGSAAVCAFAGVLLVSGLRIYTPLAGFTYLLDGIAAVFIGAAMHVRNRPNIPGTVVGVVFLSILSNGLDLLGIDFNTKAALRGIILLVVLTVAFAVAKRSYSRQA